MKLEDNPLLLLPDNLSKKIKEFYQLGGEEIVRTYVHRLEREYNIRFRTLKFDLERGLTNISISTSCGLDLNSSMTRFEAHNIYDLKSKEAEPLVKVVLEYIGILE